MLNKILWLIAIGIFLLIIWPAPEVSYGPGVKAPLKPVQTNLSTATSFTHKDYQITPLAQFYIQAKVLGKERYFVGRESELSPIDFALGWGRMSDETVLSHFDISQRNRWYYWKTDNMVIPRSEVQSSSANMHMVPSSKEVEQQLAKVKEGEIVTLTGKLIAVKGNDGWRWRSSLSRTDTGNGACELIWVESVEVK